MAVTPVLQPISALHQQTDEDKYDLSSCEKDESKRQPSHYSGVQVVMLYDMTSPSHLLSQVSACAGSECSIDNQTASGLLSTPAVNKTVCSVCGVTFGSHSEQSAHFKSGWHQLSVRRQLRNISPITEAEFADLCSRDDSSGSSDDASETSGSDTDDGSEMLDDFSELPVVRQRAHCVDNLAGEKIVFSNGTGKLLSINRCLVADLPKEHLASDVELCQKVKELASNTFWIVMMASGGHFAGAVFDGPDVVQHKTFHRYVVRAKRGTCQSQRDGKGGNAPKSAGASLRRYNETAFTEEIQELLSSWSNDIAKCSRIFVRAPGHNRLLFFGGKNPVMSRTDPRVCPISIMTKRPTFREVKRVQRVLATITVVDEKTVAKKIDQSKELPDVKRCSLSSSSASAQLVPTGQVDSSLCSSEANSPPEVLASSQSPHRDVSAGTFADSGGPSSTSTTSVVNVSDHSLINGVAPDPRPPHDEDSRGTCGSSSKESPMQATDSKAADFASPAADANYDRLYTACKTGSLDEASFLVRNPPESWGDSTKVIINRQTGQTSVTLLHVASKAGHVPLVRLLLEHGADPAVRDVHNNTPYVCATKEVKCEFRRFMADNMDLYDYVRAQIPGPLTDEIENERKIREAAKKKAKRIAKKEKEKELKRTEKKAQEEAESKRIEDLKKQEFLALSDREKRALAAEQRLKLQQTTSSVNSSIVRCWQCGGDMTGKVPFEYFDYKFCSTSCLKTHRTTTTR